MQALEGGTRELMGVFLQTPKDAAKPKRKTRKMMGRKRFKTLKETRAEILLKRQRASASVSPPSAPADSALQARRSGSRRTSGMRSDCT